MKQILTTLSSLLLLLSAFIFLSCQEKVKGITAQEVVDRAIAVSGGDLYEQSNFSFRFRDVIYTLERKSGKEVQTRIRQTDSGKVTDIRNGAEFRRYVEDKLITVPDSMANVYSNSINSVHYFAYLPHGLNDAAVNKELLGIVKIRDRSYYKVRVTFDEQGGGEDFEDVFVYWMDTETFKLSFLAYEFHVNGGGLRFREAFNERYVNGIRFVDYRNYKPKGKADILSLDSRFGGGELQLLSEIRLEDIEVSRDSYN